MTSIDRSKPPVYRGMKKYVSGEDGYGMWLPSDWRQIDMSGGHKGVIFTPYADNFDTCIAVEKHMMPYKVVIGDLPVLRKGLEEGIKSLPGAEIEKIEEIRTATLIGFDAHYTFLENGQRRSRWLRDIYWGEGHIVVIAQGKDAEDFAYWKPMIFNTLMTLEIGLPQ